MSAAPLPAACALPAKGAAAMAVALVEDDPACRQSFAAALDSAPDVRLAWAAATRTQALALLATEPLDVLLVDLGLPDGSGLEVIAAARARWPACAPMVCTIFGDEEHVLAAIEAGAMGYLLKDATPATVVQEVHSLHAGGSPINPLVARKLLVHARQGNAAPEAGAAATAARMAGGIQALSAREHEVLRLVSRGHTLVEVAGALGVSQHTARTFVRRIYAKLQVNSRADAVRVAAHQGLLDGP
ncbi:response regulator [Ottowia testudinis]|uniref:Response regulator transcription factor n=1 Tax=Ottowia testudinis TaxID=2816950 RepID=A0A975H6I7_9BURK|nr:response regulator transcription factor [Ottowia testudinis]QTD46052.1 response regulator transcription factor [Ottowia testudinis]